MNKVDAGFANYLIIMYVLYNDGTLAYITYHKMTNTAITGNQLSKLKNSYQTQRVVKVI